MKFNAACLQLTSNDNPSDNLDIVLDLSTQSILQGADFILTPENTFLLTLDANVLIERAESFANSRSIKSITFDSMVWITLPTLVTR